MKILTFLVAVLFSQISFAQKEGTYLSPDDALCTNWEFVGDPAKAPILAGIQQNYLSIVPGSAQSTMANSKLLNGAFICPTYFYLSKDEKNFYFEILGDLCNEYHSIEEKFITVEYNIGKVKKVNTIEINGSKHEIEEMKTILTLTIDGENYHYAIVEQ